MQKFPICLQPAYDKIKEKQLGGISTLQFSHKGGERGIFFFFCLIKDSTSFVVGIKKVKRSVKRGGNAGQSEAE